MDTNKLETVQLETLSFEQAMLELETLVKRLEEGRLPLEEAIGAFERGSHLKRHCEQKLEAAKMRVEQITISNDGKDVRIEEMRLA
ncbi:MAG: exodeoxyribonuclease VII small subunit [Alphaproteobacteria bacterium]|nr:exodeoxyribonuclease VII small subunit [Alphaproteobacteria bacterium]